MADLTPGPTPAGESGSTPAGQGGRLRIPTLSSRSSRWWGVATVVGAVGVVVWQLVTAPENRVAAGFVLVGLLVAVLAVVTASTRLDGAAGMVERVRLGVLRRRVALAPTTRVELVNNRGGVLLLGLRADGARRRLFVSVLALTDYMEESLPAPVLREIADTLARHRPIGAAAVARDLRAQAAHVEAGGRPRTSPLASRITRTVTQMAKAGGAGGLAGGS